MQKVKPFHLETPATTLTKEFKHFLFNYFVILNRQSYDLVFVHSNNSEYCFIEVGTLNFSDGFFNKIVHFYFIEIRVHILIELTFDEKYVIMPKLKFISE